MKKNNTRTTEKSQRRQLAAGARRKRRVAARALLVERQVNRRLKPLSDIVKGQEKQIKELIEKLATPSEVS